MHSSKWVRASCIAACGIGLSVCAYAAITYFGQVPSSSTEAATTPAAPSPFQTALPTPEERAGAFIDSEQEFPRARIIRGLTDSDLEDEASQPIRRVVQVDQGDTLMNVLIRSGVKSTEAANAIEALRNVYNPRRLRVGQEVVVTFSRPHGGIGWGQFSGISLRADPARTVQALRTTGVSFNASEKKHETTQQSLRFKGSIQSSLFQSGQSAGIPAQVLIDMIRAMSYDVDFQRDIQPGDGFEVIFERSVDSKGTLVQDGVLLYATLTLKGAPITIYRHTDSSGNADYYNAKGENIRKALLKTPVDGARISSAFGRRKHPILGYSKMHKGIDFAVPTGTPIMAAGDAVVVEAGWKGSYGNYVRLQHNPQYSTAYAHMSRIAVKRGAKIRQGQTVGYVGSTGRSTGPHLHYEILANGTHVNPLGVKFKSGTTLAGKELQIFRQESVQKIERLRQILPDSNAASLVSLRTETP